MINLPAIQIEFCPSMPPSCRVCGKPMVLQAKDEFSETWRCFDERDGVRHFLESQREVPAQRTREVVEQLCERLGRTERLRPSLAKFREVLNHKAYGNTHDVRVEDIHMLVDALEEVLRG